MDLDDDFVDSKDVSVKGGDYSLDNIVGAQDVLEYGGHVEVLDFIEYDLFPKNWTG